MRKLLWIAVALLPLAVPAFAQGLQLPNARNDDPPAGTIPGVSTSRVRHAAPARHYRRPSYRAARPQTPSP